MDVDGASPDSGVNKEFVVSKPKGSPALTDVSDAEVHPFFGLLRAMSPEYYFNNMYGQFCFDWVSAKSCRRPKTKTAPMSVWSLTPHHVPESSTIASTSTCPPGFLRL